MTARRAVRRGRKHGWALRSAVSLWRNTTIAGCTSFQRAEMANTLRHEMWRALRGIDGPNAWSGDRNARLRRFVAAVRALPAPRLP
jgi:hypothetical protein